MFLHIPSARNLLPEHCHQDESAGTAQTHLENQVPETSGSGLPSTSVNISVYTCKTLSHQTKKKPIILLVHFSPKHHKSDFWPLNLIHLHLRCHRGYSWDWKTLYKFNSIKVIWKHQPWLATEKKYAAVIRVLCTFFPADILSVSLVGNYSGSECCRCFYDLKLKIEKDGLCRVTFSSVSFAWAKLSSALRCLMIIWKRLDE